jgi:hypothetical protein
MAVNGTSGGSGGEGRPEQDRAALAESLMGVGLNSSSAHCTHCTHYTHYAH